MAVYKTRTRDVWVIGHIWQPGVGVCSMRYSLPKTVPPTSEAIKAWLNSSAGDFKEIIDFAAIIEGVEIDWAVEESALIYWDTIRED